MEIEEEKKILFTKGNNINNSNIFELIILINIKINLKIFIFISFVLYFYGLTFFSTQMNA